MKRWLSLAFVVACHRHAPGVVHDRAPDAAPPAPPASASASASASAAASPPAAPDTCATFAEKTKREVDVALAKFPLPEGYPAMDLHSPVGFCRATPHGVWRIEMPDYSAADNQLAVRYSIESRFRIVHLDAAGHRAERVMKETLSDYGGRDKPREPTLFDFDGDGEPEIYVELHEEGDEGHRARQIELLTYRDGAVAPYAPATAYDLAGLDDVDHDGRPDLVVYAGYEDTLERCGSEFPYDFPPPRFVAHSLASGAFALDDAAAKAHARAWCPAAPAKIASSTDALCARLWAKTPADVAREKARVASCAEKPCEDDCSRRKKWFGKTPPLTL